jgi:hypothetical protein
MNQMGFGSAAAASITPAYCWIRGLNLFLIRAYQRKSAAI